jgi:recombination protein RecA
MVSQPDSGEQALEITEILIRSGAVDIVVVDSVAALVPKAELDGEMGDAHVGLQARLMSQALRKLTGIVSKSKTALLFINQIRDKIGVMFGSPETTTGGRALKFYASMRIDIRRIGAIKEGEETTGSRTRLRVVKNKVAPPFRSAEFDILYGEGISKEGDLIDLGIAHRIVEKAGSWFSYGEIRLGQGRENARVFLKDNPDLAAEIDKKVRAILGLTKNAPNGETAAPAVPTVEAPRPVATVESAPRPRPRPEAVRTS